MLEPIINLAAIEPLFAPHEEPNQHRARAQGDQPSQVKKGRRPSKIAIAQSLRSHVKQWRETDYPGASDTTRELLHHWFGRDHLIEAGGQRIPFRYYFCQREAMETLIYAWDSKNPVGAVFDYVKKEFQAESEEIYKLVSRINSFRNTYVAHQKKELIDPTLAKSALAEWTSGLRRIWELLQ